MRSRAHQEKDTTYKDRDVLFDSNSATSQHKMSRAALKDYSLKHKVEMAYDMNNDSMRDRIFVLIIDSKTKVVLDWEEMMRVGRFV